MPERLAVDLHLSQTRLIAPRPALGGPCLIGPIPIILKPIARNESRSARLAECPCPIRLHHPDKAPCVGNKHKRPFGHTP